MLFRLSTVALVLMLCVIVGGGALIGVVTGRWMRARSTDHLKEASAALQTTLLGFVGLLLAFGLSLAVGRYETRRATVADEANAIGTAYLRAQTIPEPMRTESLRLIRRYTDVRIALSDAVPDSAGYDRARERTDVLTNRLWGRAGEALNEDPTGSATRLYVDTLNEMIDMDTTRQAALSNRIPAPVMWLQIFGASIALGVLGFYLALSGRSLAAVAVATVVVVLILFVTFDLDRPRRGFITIPDAPLIAARTGMDGPPAASGPTR
jgi:hypothetical protein